MTIKTQEELEEYILSLDVDFDFKEIVEALDDDDFLNSIPFHNSVTPVQRRNWISDAYVKVRQGLIGS